MLIHYLLVACSYQLGSFFQNLQILFLNWVLFLRLKAVSFLFWLSGFSSLFIFSRLCPLFWFFRLYSFSDSSNFVLCFISTDFCSLFISTVSVFIFNSSNCIFFYFYSPDSVVETLFFVKCGFKFCRSDIGLSSSDDIFLNKPLQTHLLGGPSFCLHLKTVFFVSILQTAFAVSVYAFVFRFRGLRCFLFSKIKKKHTHTFLCKKNMSIKLCVLIILNPCNWQVASAWHCDVVIVSLSEH